MARKFAEPINLQQLEIQNVRLQQLSSPPGSPVSGQIWYNTADNRPQWYDGTSNWEIYPPATAATANTAVIRDGSGNFSATTITANLTGTASIATTLNPTANVPMNGFKLTGLLDPTSPQDAATKNYVDSVASGLDVKGAVLLATTAALPAYTHTTNTLTATSNGVLTIDGVATTTIGQRILVKNETGGNAPYNGIYVVSTVGAGGTPYVLTRSTDANTSSPNLPGTVQTGMFCFVESGTVNTGGGFVLTTTGSIVLDSTNLTFTQFSGAGELIAGNGITISSNTVSVNAGSAFTFSSGSLILANIVTAATATSITYNAQGQVTAGADIITSNGLVARTGAGTFSAATVTGTTNQITVTGGGGTTPTIAIASGYVGQTSITTLGTISSGTWTGTSIAPVNGGTGLSSGPTAGQLLIGQTGGTYTLATLTNGTNISITSASGSITINTTGIPSGSGAANEIAFWNGTSTLTGTAGFTYTTTSGANLFSTAAGTSTATTATTASAVSITYTGGVGSVVVAGSQVGVTATPGSSSTGTYIGVYSFPSASSAANVNAAGASIQGVNASPSFATSNTSGATVLLALYGFVANASIGSSNATGTNTVTTVASFYANPGTWTASGGGGLTVTNYYGIYLGAVTLSTTTITNNYGIYQADANATNSFAGPISATGTITQTLSTATASAFNGTYINNTYTGPAGSVALINIKSAMTITPSAASTATYYGIVASPSVTGAANAFASGASVISGLFNPSFTTTYTTGATVLASLAGVYSAPSVGSTNASGTNTVTSVYGVQVAPGTWTASGGGGLTVTNYYGIYLGTVTLSTTTITNRYGVYQTDAAATNSFAGLITSSNTTAISGTTGAVTLSGSLYAALGIKNAGAAVLDTGANGSSFGGALTVATNLTITGGQFTQSLSSASTSALTNHSVSTTFTGNAGSVALVGIQSAVTITPSAASTASYTGIYTNMTVTGAANVFAAGATVVGVNASPAFSTANTTGATVLASLYGGYFSPSVGSTNATTTNTVTTVYGVAVSPGTWTASGGGGLTVTTYYGLYLGAVTLSTTTITNRYGVYQADANASNVFAGTATIQGLLTLNTATSNFVITQGTASSGTPTIETFTGAAHTGLTASTEINDVNWNLARTVTFANGTIGTQRAVLIQAPTYQFTSAGTITKAATFAISGAPGTGSHTTYTNTPYAFWVQGGQSQFDGAVSIGDGNNILIGTSSGTQIGGASSKLGFFGTSAVAQQTGNAATGLSNLGLITSATWPATSLTGQVPIGNGGTGLNVSSPANGTLFIGNGTGFTLATLTAGTNISVTNTSGVITIAATGVGTVNKYSTSVGDGSTTSFAITHSLGTLDVEVCVYDNSGLNEITTDVIHTSTSQITVNFAVAPTTNQYRIVVMG